MTSRITLPRTTTPGHHHIVLAFGYEDSVDHLMSGTNWTTGLPVWNDGNDVHDLSEADLRTLRENGAVENRGASLQPWSGRAEWRVIPRNDTLQASMTIWGTAFEVEVRERPLAEADRPA